MSSQTPFHIYYDASRILDLQGGKNVMSTAQFTAFVRNLLSMGNRIPIGSAMEFSWYRSLQSSGEPLSGDPNRENCSIVTYRIPETCKWLSVVLDESRVPFVVVVFELTAFGGQIAQPSILAFRGGWSPGIHLREINRSKFSIQEIVSS